MVTVFDGFMLELVDKSDLKSGGQQCPCEFDSHWSYFLNASMLELVYKSVSKTDTLNWAAGSSPAGSTFFHTITILINPNKTNNSIKLFPFHCCFTALEIDLILLFVYHSTVCENSAMFLTAPIAQLVKY
jgi:hypothetical protein